MLLRDSEYKGDSGYNQVLELARNSKGEDYFGYRSEFIKLVEIAQGLAEPVGLLKK
jgi:Ca-activated chloride channel family protein